MDAKDLLTETVQTAVTPHAAESAALTSEPAANMPAAQAQSAKLSRSSRNKTRMLAGAAMLTAVSFVLHFLEFPIPLAPAHMKMDISDMPALIGAFAYGPAWGAAIELAKNVLYLLRSSTGGVGELANFLMGSALVVPAGIIYKRSKSKKTAVRACIIGSLCKGIVAVFANYWIMLPLYESFMPLDRIIAMYASALPFIETKLDVVLYSVLPFNVLKGALSSIVTMLIYKRLSPVLKG